MNWFMIALLIALGISILGGLLYVIIKAIRDKKLAEDTDQESLPVMDEEFKAGSNVARNLVNIFKLVRVLVGLLIVSFVFFAIINPNYVGLLFTNRLCGWPMLGIGIGLGLIGMGTAVIQKFIDIDI